MPQSFARVEVEPVEARRVRTRSSSPPGLTICVTAIVTAIVCLGFSIPATWYAARMSLTGPTRTQLLVAPPASITPPASTSCDGFDSCEAATSRWISYSLPYDADRGYPSSYPFVAGRTFPKGFHWGLGTAAYQVEGAYRNGGRGASIWDTFSGADTVGMPGSVCHTAPCPVSSVMGLPGSTGNVANNHYELYAEDVEMMSTLGNTAYRFSVAWPRIFPTGDAAAGPNPEGVAFYHKLIDALVAKGIEPVITLYHWDLPQGLLDAAPGNTIPPCTLPHKQGWFECTIGEDGKVTPTGSAANTVIQFTEYARFMFTEYGSKVRQWATFNEAWSFTQLGSGWGKAPSVAPYMDVTLWPLIAGHNVILGHLGAVKAFRELQREGKLSASSEIGMVNNMDWREPHSTSSADQAAAQVEMEKWLCWFADPVYGGFGVHDYPDTMKALLPNLPAFTDEEKADLAANRPDYFGQNHYGAGFLKATTEGSRVIEDGIVQGQSVWLFAAGWGLRQLLRFVSKRYGLPPIYVTELGFSLAATDALGGRYDPGRLAYYSSYLSEAHQAITVDGVDLRGIYAWSLMDNFEWERGYLERFGVIYTDFRFGTDPNAPNASTPVYDPHANAIVGVCGLSCLKTEIPDPSLARSQTRHAKSSLKWLQSVWRTNELQDTSYFQTAALGGDTCFGNGTYTVNNHKVACSWRNES